MPENASGDLSVLRGRLRRPVADGAAHLAGRSLVLMLHLDDACSRLFDLLQACQTYQVSPAILDSF